MISDTWRIVRRDAMLFRGCLQTCVVRDSLNGRSVERIPIGPVAATIDELRDKFKAMLAACDQPILEEGEHR